MSLLGASYRPATASRRRRQGFTLVELSVVVLVMGLLAAVAAPRFADSIRHFRVSAAADRIAADLVQAQSAAYGSSGSKTITFNVPGNSYELVGVRPLERASGRYIVNLSDYPYHATLVSVWGQTSVQTITFDGYGTPDNGGTIVVECGGLQKAIVVSAATGTAVVQ